MVIDGIGKNEQDGKRIKENASASREVRAGGGVGLERNRKD